MSASDFVCSPFLRMEDVVWQIPAQSDLVVVIVGHFTGQVQDGSFNKLQEARDIILRWRLVVHLNRRL